VPVRPFPVRWEHYSGRPGFLSSDTLFIERMLTIARGGYSALSTSQQRSLRALEGQHDVWYRVLPSMSLLDGSCKLAMLSRPMRLPTVDVWQDIMDISIPSLEKLRGRIEQERTFFGISVDNKDWVVDAKVLLHAIEHVVGIFPLKANITRDIQAYLSFMGMDRRGRAPAVILRGDEREGWEHADRRREHDISLKGQNAAVLIAKTIIRQWFERSARDWLRLLQEPIGTGWLSAVHASKLEQALQQDLLALPCDASFEGMDYKKITDCLVDCCDEADLEQDEADVERPSSNRLLGGALF